MVKRAKSILIRYAKFQHTRSPQTNIVLGFLTYTLVGFLLLLIPFFHQVPIGFIDNLFTASSAISTTGLTTVDVGNDYNFWGQLIIIGLVQIGGIGYMTLNTYFLLFTTRKITRWHQQVLGTEFSLPSSIKIKDFIGSVILFTIAMELIGCILLFTAFHGDGMSTSSNVWNSIFHSISAFCTAGFNILPEGFEPYKNDGYMNFILSFLSIGGSLGFIVVTDLYYRVTGKSKKLSFTTKVIFYGFVVLLSLGTIIIYLSEPSVHLHNGDPWLISFFQAMTSTTTVGFNTVPLEMFHLSSMLFVAFLMYVGASPSGTSGGMKITTFYAMVQLLYNRLRGNLKISFLGRKIPFERLYMATSIFIMYTFLIFLGCYLISLTEPEAALDKILFEVASALGTVGLSAGLTAELSDTGKLIFSAIMFIGRVGVLTFGFSLLASKNTNEKELLEDDMAI